MNTQPPPGLPDLMADLPPLELARRCLDLVTGIARTIAAEGWEPTAGPRIDAAMRQASAYAQVSMAESLASIAGSLARMVPDRTPEGS
jgi:hypothetical protein